jgi:2-keto-4-pentenoate hydratase/2-oxohepta-3-ene-1,7-dioic acid hydratase in catechol pathway
MQICRFLNKQSHRPKYGVLKNEKVICLQNENIFAGELLLESDVEFASSEIVFLPPVVPSKIVCVGRNYVEHAKELGNEVPAEPLLFLKAPSAIVTDGDAIILPAQSERVEHEGEIGVVIGRTAKNVSPAENPLSYIFGYLCLNDVTARDLQRRDVQFTRAKSFDTFCPVGHLIETELDPDNIELTLRVNDVVKQRGFSSQMAFSIAELVRYVSNQMTLLPGDILATGTPAGVSEIKSGDTIEISINGFLNLRNPVA